MGNSGMKRANVKLVALGTLGAAAVWAGFFASAVPARAFDDKPSTFEPLLNMFALGKDSEDKPDIDFRERPKLVVPRNMDLPPPQTDRGARAANWPKDQEIVRRQQAAAAARAPRESVNINRNPTISPTELMKGRSASFGGGEEICPTKINGVPDCSALTPADKLKQVFSLNGGSGSEAPAAPGVEPARDYLTEPPSGYRAPRQVLKATREKGRQDYQTPTAAEYARGYNPNKSDDN